MKKIYTLIILILVAFSIKAQSTLQFSQVLLVSSSQTVPSGRVWKVVSVPSTNTLVPSTGSGNQTVSKLITVNSSNLVISRSARYYSSNSAFNSETATDMSISHPTELPLWLPPGTLVAPGTNTTYINVIEFFTSP